MEECKKLKSIPDKLFKDLIELGASPIREDSEIDRDCRVIEYEELLKSKGFEYKETHLGRGGGIREYENSTINKTVDITRDWDTKEIQYWIGLTSNGKELGIGKGIQNLKRKI
jgi:hypothetical protein